MPGSEEELGLQALADEPALHVRHCHDHGVEASLGHGSLERFQGQSSAHSFPESLISHSRRRLAEGCAD